MSSYDHGSGNRSVGRSDSAKVLRFLQLRPGVKFGQQWEEERGPAIDKDKQSALWDIAVQRWGERAGPELRYWLACHGYYRVIWKQWTEGPVAHYSGSLELIPQSDYGQVKKELQ